MAITEQVQVAQVVPAAPSSDEKTLAVLAHALQLISGFIAPLVILLVKLDSKFVRFHALQVLFLHIVYLVFFAGLMMTFFIGLLASAPALNADRPPIAFFVLFPALWLGLIGVYVLTLVLAIVYAVKAGRGEWAGYPLIGRLAARAAGVMLP